MKHTPGKLIVEFLGRSREQRSRWGRGDYGQRRVLVRASAAGNWRSVARVGDTFRIGRRLKSAPTFTASGRGVGSSGAFCLLLFPQSRSNDSNGAGGGGVSGGWPRCCGEG